MKIFQRARELHTASQLSFKTPLLEFFLSEKNKTEPWIDVFAQLNDAEVLTNVNYWQHEKDACIANLSRMLVNRNLYKIHLSNEKISTVEIENKRKDFLIKNIVAPELSHYFVFEDVISNYAYRLDVGQINILMKNGEVVDVLKHLNHLNIPIFTEAIIKHYICYTV